jgi:hypothetical protein
LDAYRPYPTSMQVAAPRDTLSHVHAVYSRRHAEADLIGSREDADLYRISQKSRTGDIEQTPVVIAGLPGGQLNAEAHQIIGGYQALEPGWKFAALDWVTDP